MAFTPSHLQQNFFNWVKSGRGSCILVAVAGSGKSTTIVRSLAEIPESASVRVLAFNKIIADEMKEKISKLGEEIGRPFRGVSASTFHSLGFSAICKKLNKTYREVNCDAGKLTKLFREKNSEEVVDLYGTFVPRLVSLAKGQGIGALCPDDVGAWWALIEHHDLSLDCDEATEETAIALARCLLRDSNNAVTERSWIDYDDQLYLPILWKLRLWQNDWVFIDEAQDTNPVRRALAKMALRVGGRLVAVGDPAQAIYGFTGASHDALELIRKEFNACELPLTVSYRCPKAAEAIVQPLVPHFSVHESAAEGEVLHLGPKATLARLEDHDVVLCRNTAPLIELAFSIIAQGRGCVVLGKEIGASLVNLIRKQKAAGIDRLLEKLEAYREREYAKFMAKGEEGKAEAITDRVNCITTVIQNLPENGRTIPALIAKLEGMFSDTNGVLTLSTVHKAKGREWSRVAILAPELMPSKWARQTWQQAQEQNLQYVAWTRFQRELIFMDGEDLA